MPERQTSLSIDGRPASSKPEAGTSPTPPSNHVDYFAPARLLQT